MEDAASSVYDASNTSGLDDADAGAGAETPDSPLWIVLMDRSQLIMTIIGLIANIASSLTLIKNGQVGRTLTLIKFFKKYLEDTSPFCGATDTRILDFL